MRMQLCANRKLTAIRWIGQWTVRVHVCRVTARGQAYEKADKGAEKSLRSRRRRKRGLRHGKCRSREGKSRRTITHAAPVVQTTDRRLKHHIRMVVHWTKRESEFRARMTASKKLVYLVDEGKPGSKYRKWKTLWRALALRVPRFQRRMIFGSSFAGYLEERLGLRLEQREKVGGFGDLLDHLRVTVCLPTGRFDHVPSGPSLAPPSALPSPNPLCFVCRALPYRCDEGECVEDRNKLRRRNAVRYSR